MNQKLLGKTSIEINSKFKKSEKIEGFGASKLGNEIK
jgi:hypothetical protein